MMLCPCKYPLATLSKGTTNMAIDTHRMTNATSFLAIHLFHFSLKNTIGLAITGAFVGGFIATLYVLGKMRKSKKELGLGK